MTTFRKFEEIEAWQKARGLVRDSHTISGQGRFAKDFALRDQVVLQCDFPKVLFWMIYHRWHTDNNR